MSAPTGVLFVKWIDASTHASWGDDSSPEALAVKTAGVCQSIGFLMYEDETSLVLAQSLDSEMQPGNQIAIPKIAIRERRIVRVKFDAEEVRRKSA